MVIDPKDAQRFISGYTRILAEVHRLSHGKPGLDLLNMLAAARDTAIANPSLVDTAASNLESADVALPEEVFKAVQSLKLRDWIFLRDTTKYSVFIDPEGKEAYAVLGLTQRLRDIVGGTGVVLRTGVLHFQGSYVCDGIISRTVWLGTNYRREYSEMFAALKKSGGFHTG